MRITEVAERPPRKCVSSGRGDGPFVDFQVQIDPPTQAPTNLYLHTLVVEEAAKLLGMVPAREVEQFRAELAQVKEEVEWVRGVLKAAAELEEALQKVKEGTDGASMAAVLADLKERVG